ncbi:hypothetical protein GE061_012859 [Apolygus lucorum]|uniref:Small integral membrane protein 8 n=1 Tax=Apolygus lucorum TaxID=248454 RepID=A0A8S9XTS6_APOLU|nr:hypothetical protein GE061_012859 [Apolygus lucorum]
MERNYRRMDQEEEEEENPNTFDVTFLGRCAFEGNPLHSRGLISYSGMSEQPPKVVESKPGDGIRSMKTSNVFRAINFELYAAPNKVIMAMGLVAVIGCTGYIIYMREKYKGMGYYPAVDSEGKEHFIKKKSKWD